MERGLLEYEIAEEFLADIKKEVGEGNEEMVKIAKLKRLEQRGRIMDEFVQELRKAARESRYEERLLIKEFKREMNRIVY